MTLYTVSLFGHRTMYDFQTAEKKITIPYKRFDIR